MVDAGAFLACQYDDPGVSVMRPRKMLCYAHSLCHTLTAKHPIRSAPPWVR